MILWCGGEDLDFQNSTLPSVSTTSGQFRSGYARCGVVPPVAGNAMKGNTFPGGAVTDAWLSFRVYSGAHNAGSPRKIGGFGQSTSYKGLVLGRPAANNGGVALSLYKYDGSSYTLLATENWNIDCHEFVAAYRHVRC